MDAISKLKTESGEFVKHRSIIERFLLKISYVGTPLRYLEFRITEPVYSKNSRKRGLLALEVSWPLKFLSSKREPSLAFVSPIR